ncbi:MAG: YbaB/EbfC family nucleoid-associated protein [candidate division Zixibacteria bacterium]|nr:YbaB/EbfC family nucleoid-associated protein [candidate division Zixibacteria bacterium]MCK4607529.1 YbaB/EbfC family nucleoid-associated protein [candidate division Zixibacteria bacterium]
MGKGGIGNMMKQVQQMQAKMDKIQAELEKTEVEGSSGGGMIKVVANGKQEILSVTIDPEVVDKDEIEMLQDLIVAAISQARQKAQELQTDKMGELTGGLNIPGLNLPF